VFRRLAEASYLIHVKCKKFGVSGVCPRAEGVTMFGGQCRNSWSSKESCFFVVDGSYQGRDCDRREGFACGRDRVLVVQRG
jgi:hypothetical protein